MRGGSSAMMSALTLIARDRISTWEIESRLGRSNLVLGDRIPPGIRSGATPALRGQIRRRSRGSCSETHASLASRQPCSKLQRRASTPSNCSPVHERELCA